jgi:hypothetical protein
MEAKDKIPMPTLGQFWRARQALERPADLARREAEAARQGVRQ